MVHLRIRLCLDKFAHRRPRQFQFPCNRALTPPLFKERSYVFIASKAPGSSNLLLKVVVPHPWWSLIRVGRNGPVMFLGFWFRWWRCLLVDACAFEALRLWWNRVRSV